MADKKVRDIATQLNTKSKRIIEKLEEINIKGKSAMSKLSDNEVNKLYEYIGFIKPKKPEKPASPPPRTVKKTSSDKSNEDAGSSASKHRGQYIIRRTEVIIDEEKKPKKNNNSNKKKSYVVKSDDSGLMPGYTRARKPVASKKTKKEQIEEIQTNNTKEEKIDKVIKETKKVEVSKENIASEKVESNLKSNEVKKEKVENKIKPMENSKQNIDEVQKTSQSEKTNKDLEKKQNDSEKTIRKESSSVNDASPKRRTSSENSQRTNTRSNTQNRQGTSNRNDSRSSNQNRQGTSNRSDSRSSYQNRQGTSNRNDSRSSNQNRQGTSNRNDSRSSYQNRQGTSNRSDSRNSYQNRQGTSTRSDSGNSYQNRQGTSNRSDSRNSYQNRQGSNTGSNTQNRQRPNNSNYNDRRNSNSNRSNNGSYDSRNNQQRGRSSYNDRTKDLNSIDLPDELVAETNLREKNKEKAQEKIVSRKIDQKKRTKKEISSATDKSKTTKRSTKPVANKTDLKESARLFSEKSTVKDALKQDTVLDYYENRKPKRRKRKKVKKDKKELQKPAIPSVIKIEEMISVKEFSEMMKKTSGSVIMKLMNLGVMATVNDTIDFDTATLIAEEFGIKTELKEVTTAEDILFDDTDDKEENLVSRPPVVVVMGHVDHGKTSLLDAIKSTNVIDTEAGGITQHIGAYKIDVNGRDITFLDTPGHEAFTSLRARGAQITDIAILVVAADDGIMPQTIEAINHAKAANVGIIIAINKIDKPNANIERVKQELTEHGLIPEEWGGDTVCVPISAKLNQNIDELLEMVILTADMLDMKADPERQAKGTVIEARLDKSKGALATLLVQRGTLKAGDVMITGTTVGKIRAMFDYKGNQIEKAGPSTPVEVFGLPEVPEAGELFYAVDDQKTARQLVEKRKSQIREDQLKKKNAVTLEDLFEQINQGDIKELNLIVKADVQGSVEAIKQSLDKLNSDDVKVKVIHDAVGTVTETDVTLAQVSSAIIIGFNVRPSNIVMEAAKENGVDIRLYSIIYEALEDIEKAMKGLLDPTFKEDVIGHAEIRDTFKVSGVGTIAGCYVTDGKINRHSKVRLVRDGIVVFDGELSSLKRFKDDVREVATGYECGMSIEKFNDIKVGDVIEAYMMVEEVR